MLLKKRTAQPRRKLEKRTTRHSDQACRTTGPTEWMKERWLPSPLHKTRESGFLVRRSLFESENRSTRNRRTRRQATPLPRDRSSKLASDWSSQTRAQCLFPIREGAGEAAAPEPKSRDKARPE